MTREEAALRAQKEADRTGQRRWVCSIILPTGLSYYVSATQDRGAVSWMLFNPRPPEKEKQPGHASPNIQKGRHRSGR